jgi:prepilin peptidase CpaA
VLFPLSFASLMVAAAVFDVRYLRIPNILSGALIVLFACTCIAGLFRPLTPHLISFAVAAIGGCILFFGNVWGGGDTKLLAAITLFLEPNELLSFFLTVAVIGGVLATVMLAVRFAPVRSLNPSSSPRKNVPYGVALAGGGLLWLMTHVGILGVDA